MVEHGLQAQPDDGDGCHVDQREGLFTKVVDLGLVAAVVQTHWPYCPMGQQTH